MRIKAKKQKTTRLKNLACGDVFMYEGFYYMFVEIIDAPLSNGFDVDAVRISTGKIYHFGADTATTPVKAVCRIRP